MLLMINEEWLSKIVNLAFFKVEIELHCTKMYANKHLLTKYSRIPNVQIQHASTFWVTPQFVYVMKDKVVKL